MPDVVSNGTVVRLSRRRATPSSCKYDPSISSPTFPMHSHLYRRGSCRLAGQKGKSDVIVRSALCFRMRVLPVVSRLSWLKESSSCSNGGLQLHKESSWRSVPRDNSRRESDLSKCRAAGRGFSSPSDAGHASQWVTSSIYPEEVSISQEAVDTAEPLDFLAEVDDTTDELLAVDPELERQVYEFMQDSDNPEAFPSKADLEKAGRYDLVEAIARGGGWLAIGWDVEEETSPPPSGSKGLEEDLKSPLLEELDGQAAPSSRKAEPMSGLSMLGGLMKAAQSGLQTIGLQDVDKRMEEAWSSLQRLKQNLEQGLAEEESNQEPDAGEDKASKAADPDPRQDKDYWLNDENIEAEIRSYMETREGDEGDMVTKEELESKGRADLADAINQRGGWEAVAAMFGLKKSTKGGMLPQPQQSIKVGHQAPAPQDTSADIPLTTPTTTDFSPSSSTSSHYSPSSSPSSDEATANNWEVPMNNFLDSLTSEPPKPRPILEQPQPILERPQPEEAVEKRTQSTPGVRRRRRKRRRKRVGVNTKVGMLFHGKAEARQAPAEAGKAASTLRVSGTIFNQSTVAVIPSVSGLLAVEPGSSLADRMAELEASLKATRDHFQANQQELRNRSQALREMREKAMAELLKATDSLEFRETQIMKTKKELRSTQAEVKALEGKVATQLKETKDILSEREQRLEVAENALRKLRATQVVWPHEGENIELVGSFDGWNKRVKLERSNAGVFATTLQLYPGTYEVKFVVDGKWKVDHLRPITYNGGNENNVLVVQ